MICEKARNDHSEKLWKLHESLQNNPELKTRDPAMVKRLIEWEAILWPPACRNPIEVIEGTVTLEQLGVKWTSMPRSERGRLLRRVNLEEHLLGQSSLPGSTWDLIFGICPVAEDDKYHNPENLGKSWTKFSDEDKKKILRAYNWNFSYIYYDAEKKRDVLYSTFLDKYQATEKLIDQDDSVCDNRWCKCREKTASCSECGLTMGGSETEHSDVLGEMCLKCFREITDQTHEWYDKPLATKILKEGVRIRQYRDSKGKWHTLYGNFTDGHHCGEMQ
jgi:hypothetical protein